jgi:hypothetical protein
VSARPVRDFDSRPDEENVRAPAAEPGGVSGRPVRDFESRPDEENVRAPAAEPGGVSGRPVRDLDFDPGEENVRAPAADPGGVSARPVRDFDFHPDEDDVRVFSVEAGGVLRFGSDVCVYAVRYGDVVLWHYAFASHWFKVNVTTDLDGRLVETGGDEPGGRFAFNCDVATPMRRQGDAVFAVDLFADLLVRADAVSFRVCDLDGLSRARRYQLIVPGEARGAELGLIALVRLVQRGELLAFLSRACPIGPLRPPAAVPPHRVPVGQVPLLDLDHRAAWVRQLRL